MEPASSLRVGEAALLTVCWKPLCRLFVSQATPEATLPTIPVTGHSTEALPASGAGHRHMIRISRS